VDDLRDHLKRVLLRSGRRQWDRSTVWTFALGRLLRELQLGARGGLRKRGDAHACRLRSAQIGKSLGKTSPGGPAASPMHRKMSLAQLTLHAGDCRGGL
jgi:hypothetical protein